MLSVQVEVITKTNFLPPSCPPSGKATVLVYSPTSQQCKQQ